MKTIVITGASSGIGRETALLFAGRGWQVAATVRGAGRLGMFAGHENIRTYLLDVNDRAAIAPCFERIAADLGPIDVLVNNAGVFATEPLETMGDTVLDGIIDTNVKGVVWASRAIIPLLRGRGGGTIVNVASVAGRVTLPFLSAYHASKWAVEGFSESLRYELAPLGIRVRIIEPGVVKTPLYREMGARPGVDYPAEYRGAFSRWWAFMLRNYERGYSPTREAATIWRAVNSRGARLRYTTDSQTRAIIVLRRLIPVRAFQWLVARVSGI